MFKHKHSNKGFTLIELIVVIAILAILASIAIPSFVGLTEEAEKARLEADATLIAQAINIHNILYGNTINDTISISKQLADKNLWPAGLDESTEAIKWVEINENGVATVKKPA